MGDVQIVLGKDFAGLIKVDDGHSLLSASHVVVHGDPLATVDVTLAAIEVLAMSRGFTLLFG